MRSQAPGSQSFTSEALRELMVQNQLRSRDISDERVLRAMMCVPREEFVPEAVRHHAYDDRPLPIGHEQTISQPYTVAFQCEALRLQGDERVLEVGTGSGYGAAVLSRLAKEVYTVERIPELASRARATLGRLGFDNVHVELANGTLGLPKHAPFDGIVVTAGGTSLPQPFLDQLSPGGRIVIPLGEGPAGQSMYRFTKFPDALQVDNLGGFCFVPLIGRYGWESSESRKLPKR